MREWIQLAPHLIWTNVPSWFLIAPLLFLVSIRILEPARTIKIREGLHFLPSLISLVLFLSFYFEDASTKLLIYNSFYNEDFEVDYVQLIYITQMFTYAYFGRRYIKKRLREITGASSDSSLVSILIVPKIFSVLAIYVVVSIVNALIYGFLDQTSISYYAIAFFVLSISIIISTIYFLNTSNEESPIELRQLSLDQNKQEARTYRTSSLSHIEVQQISETIRQAMEDKELFKNTDLDLKQFALECEIPSHHITQCLNQFLKKSFFQFVNEYRVSAVKKAFHQNRHHSRTLLAIAEESGFKSQSSFYRIVKSQTGMTPKQLAVFISSKSPT